MSDHEVRIGVMLCWSRWEDDRPGEDEPVEEVAKRAFRMTRDESYTWFTSNDDHRFRIGCGVLLMHYKDTPIFFVIQNTLSALKALSAAISGVPVDFGAVLGEETETLPLLPWYKETAA